MSRLLLPAFIMALILHSLLAWVKLDLFKRPIPVRNLPKTLTIDIAGPKPAKKPSVVKDPSIVVKEPEKKPIVKKEIKRKIKPKVKEKRRIQPERPIIKEKSTKKVETLAHLTPVDLHGIKKEELVLEEVNPTVPDMVDIPIPLSNIKDTTNSSFNFPITYAFPIYKKNTLPQYPLFARRRGYQGKVLLEVLVTKDGKAGSIRLARSSGYEVLDRAAIKGVRNWLFHPAKKGDDLVEMWVKIPIRFQLK